MNTVGIKSASSFVLAIAFALAAGLSQAQESPAPESADQGVAVPSQPVEESIEEVVAVGRSLGTAEKLVNERKDDAVVVDLLGADAISRLGDSTVAAALRRMPGVTLVSNKFIYIRGLGERYSSSSLNGAQIPSPDLTRNVIPLDIFPAAIVDSIRIQKTYSPSLPANFGGGNVDIRTRGIPDEFTATFELGAGGNSETHGDLPTYPGGGHDYLGSDDGSRALSADLLQQINRFQGNVDVQGILATLQAEDPTLTSAQAFAQAQTINREMALMLNREVGLTEKKADPDINFKGSVGNNIVLNDDWELGYLVGGTYATGWRETVGISRNFRFPDERTDTETESTRNVNVSGNLNFGLRFTEDHEISTTSLYLRDTDDETAIRSFFDENRQISDGLGNMNVRLQFEERNLFVNQIKGSHHFGEATRERLPDGLVKLFGWIPAEAELTWFYSRAKARTDIPNQVSIDSQTVTDPVTSAVLDSAVVRDPTAADYRFTDLDDDVRNWGWMATYPVSIGNSDVELGFGYDHGQKARTYEQVQFSVGPLSVSDPTILQGPLDEVFSDTNILDPANNYAFDIRGTNNQSYIAATMTDAVFGQVDWTWNDRWRVAAGLRWEDYRQAAVDWNPFGFSATSPQVTTDTDVLQRGVFKKDEIYPAAAITYMTSWWAETFQLRFGYSQTAVRPDLREITDASYVDPRTGSVVDGNPDVRPADVTNYDLRAELFFASGDSLTMTLFYKDIQNPIEFTESAASDTNIARELINGESAEVYGIEFEGLKELGFLGDAFSPFFVQGNLTLQDSKLVVGEQADAPTNPERPMTGASDYVVNMALGYDSPNGRHTATVGYNVFGERLYVPGRLGAPDGYEQPFNSLDIIYSWYPTNAITVKAKVQNILQETIEIKREDVVTFLQDPGSTYALSFQWAF